MVDDWDDMVDDWDDPYNYSCHDVGMSGNCGIDCPVLNRGDCDIEDEMINNLKVYFRLAFLQDSVCIYILNITLSLCQTQN